jgi:hypothetical protein
LRTISRWLRAFKAADTQRFAELAEQVIGSPLFVELDGVMLAALVIREGRLRPGIWRFHRRDREQSRLRILLRRHELNRS